MDIIMPDISFTSKEFEYFHPRYRRNREYNKQRLKVRRKLGEIGTILLQSLKKNDIPVTKKTSLHHPYSYNSYEVNSIWLYFSPSAKTYNDLKKILGDDLGKDLDVTYLHTLLLVGIEHQGLFISLKIHPQAWWDGQNLKNKCSQKTQRMVLLEKLILLDDFYLKLHEWPNKHLCSQLNLDKITEFIDIYTPGEHWLHVNMEISRENPIATSPDCINLIKEKLLSLIPIYSFIKWNPKNNFIF